MATIWYRLKDAQDVCTTTAAATATDPVRVYAAGAGLVLILDGEILRGATVNGTSWTERWQHRVPTVGLAFDTVDPLCATDGTLIATTAAGLVHYTYTANGIVSLGVVGAAADVGATEWVVKYGRLFRDPPYLGLVTLDEQGMRVYRVRDDAILERVEFTAPTNHTQLALQMARESDGHLFVAAIESNPAALNIAIRGKQALTVFRVAADAHQLELVATARQLAIRNGDMDESYFANVTGAAGLVRDAIQLGATGLRTYQYRNGDYVLCNRDPLFGVTSGWRKQHSRTISFADITLDGRDDLIYTGPTGLVILSYDSERHVWRMVLSAADLPPAQRYSRALLAPPGGLLLVHHATRRRVRAWRLEAISGATELSHRSLPPPPPPPPRCQAGGCVVPPKNATRVPKHRLPLRDLLDYNVFNDCVETRTGQLRFSLNLLDTVSPYLGQVQLTYDGTRPDTADILGVGWSMPGTYIVLDDNGSIFKEDHIYTVMTPGNIQPLRWHATGADRAHHFRVTRRDSVSAVNDYYNITYDAGREQWQLNTHNLRHTFGGRVDTVAYDIGWNYWRRVGSALSGRHRIAKLWYLAAVDNAAGERLVTLTYAHENVSPDDAPLTYTREINLKQIVDHIGRCSVVFVYGTKRPAENDAQPWGGVELKTAMIDTKYLRGYSLQTDTVTQNVRFRYEVVMGVRYLTSVEQPGDVEPVLTFTYDRRANVLTAVKAPHRRAYTFLLQSLCRPSTAVTVSAALPADTRVDYLHDCAIFTYRTQQRNELSMHIYCGADMSREKMVATVTDWHGEYQVFVTRHLVTVQTIGSTSGTKLCTFWHRGGQWSDRQRRCQTVAAGAVIRHGVDFMVVADASVLHLHVYDAGAETFKTHPLTGHVQCNAGDVLVATSDRMFATLCGSRLQLYYRSSEDIWRHVLLASDAQPAVAVNTATIDGFDLTQQTRLVHINVLKQLALKVHANFVTVTALVLDDASRLFSDITVYTLDESYQTKPDHTKHIRIPGDDLNTHTLELNLDSTTTATFKYLRGDGINRPYRIVATKFRGAGWDQLQQQRQQRLHQIHQLYNEGPTRQVAENNLEKSMEEQITKILEHITTSSRTHIQFLFDFHKYLVHLKDDTTIVCGRDDIYYDFDGNDWVMRANQTTDRHDETDTEQVVHLSARLQLRQTGRDSPVELMQVNTAGDTVRHLHLNTSDLMAVAARHPAYVAYQRADGHLCTILFARGSDEWDGDGDVELLASGERLLVSHCSQTIITTVGTAPQTLRFRVPRIQMHVTAAQTIAGEDATTTRHVGFSYNVLHARAVGGQNLLFDVVNLRPGDNVMQYGEVVHEHHVNGTKTVRSCNATGHTVHVQLPSVAPPDSVNPIESRQFSNVTLMDKQHRIYIAQFYPHCWVDEEVAYYGFEDHEQNVIGAAKRWQFTASAVRRDNFPLTGRSGLHLATAVDELSGWFAPVNQQLTYRASTWLRPSVALLLRTLTPHLKVSIYRFNDTAVTDKDYLGTVLASVTAKQDGWFLLEAVVDLKTFHQQPHDRLQMLVSIAPTLTVAVDVDHVLFVPQSRPFQVHVYDTAANWHEVALITPQALVRRHIYDQYNSRIATVDEHNNVRHFYSYTKLSARTDAGAAPRCDIGIGAQRGRYETFDADAFSTGRWCLSASSSQWTRLPHALHHIPPPNGGSQTDTVAYVGDGNVLRHPFCIRINYHLLKTGSSIAIGNLVTLQRTTAATTLTMALSAINPLTIPSIGEIVLYVGPMTQICVFIDGQLRIDNEPAPASTIPLVFTVTGDVFIADVFIMDAVEITISYRNAFDEVVQVVTVDQATTVIEQSFAYDAIGRCVGETSPTRHSTAGAGAPPMLGFRLPTTTSQWKRYHYYSVPEESLRAVEIPNTQFALDKRPFLYPQHTTNTFLLSTYPLDAGFTHRVERTAHTINEVTVLDAQRRRVAYYVGATGDANGLLSTYEYDAAGQPTATLPPAYHVRADTFTGVGGRDVAQLRRALGIHTTYTATGDVASFSAPDVGRTENVYATASAVLRFIVNYARNNDSHIVNISYLNYDAFNRVSGSGWLTAVPLPTRTQLNAWLDDTVPVGQFGATSYQRFEYNDAETDPFLRQKVRCVVTADDQLVNTVAFAEEFVFDVDDNEVCKRIYIDGGVVTVNKRFDTKKRVTRVQYPFRGADGRRLVVEYTRNALGQVLEVRTEAGHALSTYTYTPAGAVHRMELQPEQPHAFTRTFAYDAVGRLTHLTDRYLTETVAYVQAGYGLASSVTAAATRTVFNATWLQGAGAYAFNAAPRHLHAEAFTLPAAGVTPAVSRRCHDYLQHAGYLDSNGRTQLRVFHAGAATDAPNVCRWGIAGRHVALTLGTLGFPHQYGHFYDYGASAELTKAKYFVGGTQPLPPLQPHTFHATDADRSQRIWQLLVQHGYLIVDNVSGLAGAAHAKSGRSLLRASLRADLRSVAMRFSTLYARSLGRLLLEHYAAGTAQIPTRTQLRTYIAKWMPMNVAAATADTDALWKMLEREQYWLRPLDSHLVQVFIGEGEAVLRTVVVPVLLKHLPRQLGEAPFDVEAYHLDENGNHRTFTTGFARYRLAYEPDTNRVSNITVERAHESAKAATYAVKHDDRGNVVRAEHKGLLCLDYHPVTGRLTSAVCADGRRVLLRYDARGQRLLKRTLAPNGTPARDLHYVRDPDGRTLVERDVRYESDGTTVTLTTAYVYDARGHLLGFYRRNNYYNVIVDHEGSTRLIELNGDIVAAYDYLPYGGLMRLFVAYPEADISYRYTGQEWDAELALYNYRARNYDPDIGRFYQVDPLGQYSSPYKYAGNSPISMIDPTGQFAIITTAIVLGVLGAYLGGAAVNRSFNVTKWKWDHPKYYIGIFLGLMTGVSAGTGLLASVAVLTPFVGVTAAWGTVLGLGVGTAYLSGVKTSGKWNPLNWDWSDPLLVNSLFNGFVRGSGAVGGLTKAAKYYTSLSKAFRILYVTTTVFHIGYGVISAGIMHNWDFTKPELFLSVLESILMAPITAHSNFKLVNNGWQKIKQGYELGTKSARQIGQFLSITDSGRLARLNGAISALNMASQTQVKQLLEGTKLFRTPGSVYEGFLGSLLAGRPQIPPTSSLAIALRRGGQVARNVQRQLAIAAHSLKTHSRNSASSLATFAGRVRDHIDISFFKNNAGNIAYVAGILTYAGSLSVVGGVILTHNSSASTINTALSDAYAAKQSAVLVNVHTQFNTSVVLHIRAVENLNASLTRQAVQAIVGRAWRQRDVAPLMQSVKHELHKALVSLNTTHLHQQTNTVMASLEAPLGQMQETIDMWLPPQYPTTKQVEAHKLQRIHYMDSKEADTSTDSALYEPANDDCKFCAQSVASITRDTSDRVTDRWADNPAPSRKKKNAPTGGIISWLSARFTSCLEYLEFAPTLPETCPFFGANHQLNRRSLDGGDDTMTPPPATTKWMTTDVNSTLLLLDVCIRKITREQYKRSIDVEDTRFRLAQIGAMELVARIEQLVQVTDITVYELINFSHLQCRLYEALVGDNQTHIPDIVASCLCADLTSTLNDAELRVFVRNFISMCDQPERTARIGLSAMLTRLFGDATIPMRADDDRQIID